MSQGSPAEEASAEVRWEMPALTLADILDRGLVFAAKDGSRPILETVYIDYQKGGVTFAAADGFCLLVQHLDTDRVDAEGVGFALRRDDAALWSTICKRHAARVRKTDKKAVAKVSVTI